MNQQALGLDFTRSPLQSCVRDGCDPRVIYLATLIKAPLTDAIGVVEALRLWAVNELPARNIGKYPNIDIACSIWWPEEKAEELIGALIKCGWVKEDPKYRLRLIGWRWQKGDKISRRRNRIAIAGGEVTERMRYEIYARDGGKCLHCGASDDLTIDHVIPVAAYGRTERSNLQTLCRPCNGRKRDNFL